MNDRPDGPASVKLKLLSLQGVHIFSSFFLWGIGLGAMTLARPLFAYSLSGSLFLVAVVSAASAGARMVASPVTGFMADRWGRRPLLVSGALLRGGSAILEFFFPTYLAFMILEFIGSIGISMWNTSADILIADVSTTQNRGRALAFRGASRQVGTLLGPAIGGLLAAFFGLRSVFLFNGVTKLLVLAIALFMIKESRPESTRRRSRGAATGRLDWSVFATRAFLSLAFTTFAVHLVGGGAFQSLFPIHARENAGLSVENLGTMLSIAGIATLAVSLPNGLLVDRYGRKVALIPGLLLLGVSAYLMAQVTGLVTAFLMVLIYGVGTGMSTGASQAYAMDLAPEDRRGAFLGVWSLFTNVGSVGAPLLIGFLADSMGFGPPFYLIGGLLLAAALVMWLFGPETHPGPAKRAQSEAPTPSASEAGH